MTSEWWVCLCDQGGNVSHQPVGEWLGQNREACAQGAVERPVAVALAASLNASQEAGRMVKKQLKDRREKEQAKGEPV